MIATVTATAMLGVLLISAFAIASPAFAQSGSASGSAQSQISYKTEYPTVEADSSNSVTIQTEHHIYKPGDTVRVTGSVSEEMREETDSDTVTVLLMNEGGTAGEEQVTVGSDGNYIASINLDSSAEPGEYSASSKIAIEADLLGLLSADIVAKLESPKMSFVVGSESSFDVQAEGGEEFDINIVSNSNVDSVDLDEEEKKLSFTVEGETGTKGVTEVTIPKAMLSGEMVVLIDGAAVSSNSNDVILKSETNAEATFEINYSHSEHTVEVTGTSVVPEFPIAGLAIAGVVGSAALVAARFKLGGFTGKPNSV